MADKLLDVSAEDVCSAISRRGTAATGITAISEEDGAEVTVANDCVAGDVIAFSACGGMTEINGETATVVSASSTVIVTDKDTSSGYTTYSGSAGRVDIVHAVSGHVRVAYDDSISKDRTITALKRATERLIELLSAD